MFSSSGKQSAGATIDQLDARTLKIGLFQIDLDVVTIKGLIQMRRILPKAEYRLIKNRKCARVSRQKRKEKTLSLQDKLNQLETENKNLRLKILNLELNKSDANSSSLSSFQDNASQSACSLHSEPQPVTCRSAPAPRFATPETSSLGRQDGPKPSKILGKPSDITELMKVPTAPPKYVGGVRRLPLPVPKVRHEGFMSPIRSDKSGAEKAQLATGKIPAKLGLPTLSMSFPLMSQEETAFLHPLSPLSGSSIQTGHPYNQQRSNTAGPSQFLPQFSFNTTI